MAYQKPKGTEDLLPTRARAWEAFKAKANEVFSVYGYELIDTPMFEQSELFTRSAGESSDITRKEIFAVRSIENLQAEREGKSLKAAHKLALRPEGTASVVRAIAQNNLVPQGGAPAKLWYAGSMFRAENVQKGRLREFHQVGIECLGATDPVADAEMIIMCMRFFESLGLKRESMTLLVNSMGDEQCRPAYTEAVRSYMEEHKNDLCDECKNRIEVNPLRAFDCKNPQCSEVMDGAPRFADHLCDDCKSRFDIVKEYLTAAGIDYVEDPRLVRGFDYYTGTVFEVQTSEGTGSQSAIGGGGHYDKLMGEISGKDLSGLGFAVGFERIMLALEATGIDLDPGHDSGVYVVNFDDSTRSASFRILQQLRDAGVIAQSDTQGRSVKSQFKVAGKAGVKVCVVVGTDELAAGQVTVRNMDSHEENQVSLDEVVDVVKALL